MIGWVVLGIIVILLILDGARNGWAGTRAILGIFRNTVVRRIIQVLLGLGITVGLLFLGSTIGFLTKITWLTVIPVAVGMVVIWLALISGAALEGIVRAWARLLGFGGISDKTTLESWEKNFLSVFFWVYLMLALYPVYNPWTGNPSMVIFIAMFGLALATYARWAAGPGKKPKIAGLIIVPLLFLYCLGKQQPSAYPFLGGWVRWIENTTGLERAKRDQSSVLKSRKAEALDENSEFLRNTREVKCVNSGPLYIVEAGIIKNIVWQPTKNEIVRAAQTINKDLDGNDVPEIIKRYFINPNQQFKFIYGPDGNGRFTKGTVKKGWAPAEDFPPYIRVRKNFEYTDDNRSSAGQRGVDLGPPPREGPDWQGAGFDLEHAGPEKFIPAGYFGLRLSHIFATKGAKIKIVGPERLVWDVIGSDGKVLEEGYNMNIIHKIKHNGWIHVHTRNNLVVTQNVHFKVVIE